MPNESIFTRRLVLCWFANFAQCMAFSLFLHFPGFLKEIGATAVQIGWISGAMAVVSIAVRPALGSVMDRRGRRGVILWGEPISVPREAGEAEVERLRARLEERLNALTAEADLRFGQPSIEPAAQSPVKERAGHARA